MLFAPSGVFAEDESDRTAKPGGVAVIGGSKDGNISEGVLFELILNDRPESVPRRGDLADDDDLLRGQGCGDHADAYSEIFGHLGEGLNGEPIFGLREFDKPFEGWRGDRRSQLYVGGDSGAVGCQGLPTT